MADAGRTNSSARTENDVDYLYITSTNVEFGLKLQKYFKQFLKPDGENDPQQNNKSFLSLFKTISSKFNLIHD